MSMATVRIAIDADDAAMNLKKEIVNHLEKRG